MMYKKRRFKVSVIVFSLLIIMLLSINGLKSVYVDRGDRFYFKQLKLRDKILYLKIELGVKLRLNKVKLFIPYSKEDVKRVMTLFLFENPDLFYISKRYGVVSKDNIVSKIELNYILKHKEYKYMKKEVDDKVDQFIVNLEKLDDVEKSYLVYSSLAEKTNYYKTGNFFNSIYGSLVINRANCEGMSSAYMYIMNKLNVPTWQVFGEIEVDGVLENHSWNVSFINGEYYYTDVTFASKHSSRDSSKFYDYLNMSCERSLIDRSVHFQNKIFGKYCFY